VADAGVEATNQILGEKAHERGRPSITDALSVTGGIAIGAGTLLIAIDVFTHHPGRPPEVAMFAALVVVGFLVLGLLPATWHPAAITLVVIGIFGTFAWWLLPHAQRFADVRPFLILTIVAYLGCFVAPRIRGRAIFVALVLLLTWLWVLGEVVGNDSYSFAPIPTPPAHTMFSLAALHRQTDVTIDDLDSSDPLYPLAQQCDDGDMASCDELYRSAADGTDFKQFASECGQNGTPSDGNCEFVNSSSGGSSNNFNPVTPVIPTSPNPFSSSSSNDKSTQIGFISLLFGLAYLFGLWALDRRGYAGLATAFVLPCAIPLFTGTETLGNAASHPWVGGLLTFVAGFLFGIVGDRSGRRFTAWFGAVMVAFGALIMALDFANLRHTLNTEPIRLLKPGTVAIVAGVAIVIIAVIVAYMLAPKATPDASEGQTAFEPPPPTPYAPPPAPVPAPAPAPAAPSSPEAVTAPASPDPSPWAPQSAPPPPAPPSWGARPPTAAPPPAAPSWPPPPEKGDEAT
jgi:hypothetical protein